MNFLPVTTRRFEYDALDCAIAVTDPLFGTARRAYDADDRMVQAVHPVNPTVEFPDTLVVNYGQDARLEVTRMADPRGVASSSTTTPQARRSGGSGTRRAWRPRSTTYRTAS